MRLQKGDNEELRAGNGTCCVSIISYNKVIQEINHTAVVQAHMATEQWTDEGRMELNL